MQENDHRNDSAEQVNDILPQLTFVIIQNDRVRFLKNFFLIIYLEFIS
jgi:hypothetical protein